MSDKFWLVAQKFGEEWPVLFRGSIYFFIPFLGIIGEKMAPYAIKGQWPPEPLMAWAAIVGATAGLVGLRAYYDGSAQRHSDEKKKNGNGNGQIHS